jgi:hypothetical protein
MLPDGIETFVGGFSRDHGVLPHLQKLHQRLADGGVVLHDEHYGK